MASDQLPPFGTFALTGSKASLLKISQRQPSNFFGKKLAILLRRLTLWNRADPVDAETAGLKIRAYIRDNVSEKKFLFMPRQYDAIERNYVAENLTDEGTFLDIGANAGIYSLTAAQEYARRSGPGHVIAVEPNPTMQARLQPVRANVPNGGN